MSTLLDPVRDFDRYISTKPPEAYPRSINNEMKLLRAHPEGEVVPFGSAIYRIQAYPGDVDLLEDYSKCCSAGDVTTRFAADLKKIVKRVVSTRLHYYSEIKAGVDERYNIDIGTMKNGSYVNIGAPLINIIPNYVEKGLITKEDGDIIMYAADNAMTSKTSQNDYDIIMYVLRKYFILRWSAEEVLHGSKRLVGNTSITLVDALNENSLIKIDEITIINGRFVEVTNAYFLSFPRYNRDVMVNEPHDVYKDLPLDIEKLYYSDMWYNPFKALKRAFALARAPDNMENPLYRKILQKLFPFISSNTSLVYQIKSELEAILIVLQTSKSIPKAMIDNQIDSMKFRLSTVIEISTTQVVDLSTDIDKIVAVSQKYAKIGSIEALVKDLKKIINRNTIAYMDKVGLNPFPAALLPPVAKYNRNVKRTPDSDPTNPLKILRAQLYQGGNAGVHSDWHSNVYSGGWNIYDFY